jgi:two-component system chemotaxis response regulator CheY
MRVLIADDEPGTRLLVATAVRGLGHEVFEAGDGEEAWEGFRAHGPEVVITDWEMPRMDGAQLARRIRGDRHAPYAYVLVLSGVADEAAARDVMEAGADDLVTKPLDRAELERKLIAAARVTGLHRRMHADARQDALTGVGNRLRLDEDLAALCGRVERYGHSYCVAMFDVDDFKAYNDAAGHQGGDEVLRAVAHALARGVRSGDRLYRYGGEEFALLFAEQPLDAARLAAERLRADVEGLAIPHPGGGVVTVSAGVACASGVQCAPDRLLGDADAALYAAKQAGRNRVEVQAPGPPPLRLLVADDDPTIRLTLGALIGREEGMELVGEAADTAGAVEEARRRRPDVILLDIDMPGGGGMRATTEIRELLPDVRIVAISGDDSQANQYEMLRAGAVGFVAKGAPTDEIVRVIRSSARW